ncbi:MAG: glycosyltransferase [Nitrososphaeria archaeon]
MKIALIEPYLLNYTGHYYNFVTELKKGFQETDSKDIVDVFVPTKCMFNDSFIKVLPVIGDLDSKNYLKVFFNNVFFLITFRKILKVIENNYDTLVFTTADGFRLWLLLFSISFKKPVFVYSHMLFSDKKQKLILQFSKFRKDCVTLFSPFSQRTENFSLIETLKRKGFNVVLDAPYPFYRPNRVSKEQIIGSHFYVSYIGPAREEKGFIDVVDFIRFCKRNQLDYKFIVQCSSAYESNVKHSIEILKSESSQNVELIEFPLTQSDYERTIQRSSIILLLYHPKRYSGAISAILLEALSMGKPVIVRSNTWLADQIQKYGGGIVISEVNPESIKTAIEKIRFNYEKFSKDAFVAGEELSKKHNGKELAYAIKSIAGSNFSNLKGSLWKTIYLHQ